MAEQRGSSPDANAQAAVAAAVAGWTPRALSGEAAAFARAVVACAEPKTPARARSLLFAAARLAAFGERIGLPPRPELLLRDAVIERLVVASERTLSPATRRTLRTNLRALERAAGTQPGPRPLALPRARAKRPYRAPEVAGYLRLARAQPSAARRMQAQALVCLGAGAGIVAAELRQISGADVVARAGGLVVSVSGPRARAVPVLGRFREPLLEAAGFAGCRYLVGGAEPRRKNLTDELARALSSDPALPRLEPGRLRSTWLSECARLIGLGAFMRAAGIRCSQRLGDLVAELPEVDEAAAVALLGGAGGGAGAA